MCPVSLRNMLNLIRVDTLRRVHNFGFSRGDGSYIYIWYYKSFVLGDFIAVVTIIKQINGLIFSSNIRIASGEIGSYCSVILQNSNILTALKKSKCMH